MRIAALEEKLRESSVEDLDELAKALDVCQKKLPGQLVQELGLELLGKITRIVLQEKRGT